MFYVQKVVLSYAERICHVFFPLQESCSSNQGYTKALFSVQGFAVHAANDKEVLFTYCWLLQKL